MVNGGARQGWSRRQWVGTMGSMVGGALGMAAMGGAGRQVLAEAPISKEAGLKEAGNELGARVYNIHDFGAKGDGTTLDTAAVQSAIDVCTRDGGGTVLVPTGKFVIGTTELKSNVTLHLAAGGVLLGSTDGKDYHAVEAIPLTGDSTLGDGNWALLFAVNARNVTIEGPGMIDGQGSAFFSQKGASPRARLAGNRRPYHVLCYRCENLRIHNLDLFQSAYHSIRVIQSHYVWMEGLHIFNRAMHNNDGFHFISCEHVTVSNCHVETQDDACALFGSCKCILVTNSSFSTRWSVFRFGGGVAENVVVSNCLLYEVYGCPIKFHGSPGSRFENMSFSNLIFQEVTGPITISAGAGGRRRNATQPASQPAAETEPATQRSPAVVRNISFSNIHGTVTTNPPQLAGTEVISGYRPGEKMSAIVVNAVGGATVENISFSNIHLTFGGGGTAEDAARRDVPEIAGEYFALGPIPAYGLYARNVRALTLDNIRFEVASPELRPAIIFDHVEDAAVSSLSAQGNAEAESLLRFISTKEVLITAPRVLKGTSAFLRLEGNESGGIVVDGGDLSKASQALACAAGAEESAVKIRG